MRSLSPISLSPIALALTATLLTTAPALASSDTMQGGSVPQDSWLSIGAIANKFTQMGYTVRGVEADNGRYEVEAIDRNGMRVEAYVDPMTGEILRQSNDD
jgi:hypothetical protein